MTLWEALAAVVATFGVALGTSLLPVGGGIEVYLLATSALLPAAFVVPLVVASAAGSIAAKTMVYAGSRRAVSHLGFLEGDRRARLAARIQDGPWIRRAVIFSGATLSVPPFYALALAAGALRTSPVEFVVISMLGQVLRFAVVWAVPQLGAGLVALP